MQKKKIVFLTSGLAMLALLLVAAPTLAATVNKTGLSQKMMSRFGKFGHGPVSIPKGIPMQKPAAMGQIVSINGSVITVTEKTVTYTIDASAAKITKGFGANASTLALTDLTVGESIAVTGTTSGTNVVATAISIFPARTGNQPAGQQPFQRPAVSGKITAINGTALTITDFKNTTYTVDASVAKITKGFGPNATAASLTDLTVGEMISASGTVSGSSVAATSISLMDGQGRMAQGGLRGNFGHGRGMNGKVTAVNGSSFTMAANRRVPGATASQTASFTVNTSATTVFKKDGQAATLNDVTTGAMVMVNGAVNATSSTITADTVNIVTKVAAPVKSPKASLVNRFLNIFKKK